MFLEVILESMKRKLRLSENPSATKYEAVKQDDIPPDECPPNQIHQPKSKGGGILCASSRKRFYFLLIITGVVLLWVGIYYKLLNHRFELPEPFRELRRMVGDGPSKNRRRFRESETENIEEVSLHNAAIINIVVVACKDRVRQAITALKSATLFTKYNLHFHIFTDKTDDKKFDNELMTWPSYQDRWMMYYIYPAKYPNIIEDDEKVDWEELFKPCASLRLFLAQLLPTTDSVIYIDTDILFLKPPEDLWNQFNNFNKRQVVGLAQECGKGQEFCWYSKGPKRARHPYVHPYGVNSGVMLMNLTRLRRLNWEKELMSIYKNNRLLLRYGDQDILNIFFNAHPKFLYTIPCEWNYRPDFCYLGNQCNRAVKNGIGILHGCRLSFQKPKVQPEFYAMYEAFKEYSFEDSVEDKIVNVTKFVFKKKFSTTSCGQMMNSILMFNTR